MNNLAKLIIIITVFLFQISVLFSQDFRYTNTIFPSSTITADVIYDTAPFINFPYFNEASTTTGDLVMDIYTPDGDSHTKRPAIIFAHSGGFIIGDRTHDDMVAFCDSFARKGYVTATIDYRQGFNVINNTELHGTRAVYRGLQDGRSAVRFLRANAATYGIDPDRIYLTGSSAGSFIALHTVYMDEPAEKPLNAGTVFYSNLVPPFFYTAPDLGGYDVGDNLLLNGTPDAIISLWGALESTDLITSTNDDPVFLVHGTDDGTVPFNSDPPFGVGSFPDVDGSNLINDQLNTLGLTEKETYFVPGEDHEFHGTGNGTWDNGTGGNAFWDTIVYRSTNFLWLQHKPVADFSYADNDLTISFTDLSTDAISWLWDFGDGNTSTVQNPTHSYPDYGNYEIFLYVENNCLSWDTISFPAVLVAPLPVVWLAPIKAAYENNETTITWSVAQQVNNEKFIVEHSLDGRQFLPIAEVKGDGNLIDEKTYTEIHKNPPVGLNYYRVVQVDFDGKFENSEVVSITVEKTGQAIRFYPNPSSGMITVNLDTENLEPIEIYNVIGELLKTYPVRNATEMLDLLELEPGLYFIKTKNNPEVQKLIIKR